MKFSIIAGFLMFFFFAGNTQNLVPNPSFEDTVICPIAPGEIYNSTGWISLNGSPDYMNSCNLFSMGVPANWGGYQIASSGNAYSAIGTFIGPISNGREFICQQLSSTLNIGTTYYFSFQVSLSLGFSVDGNCASNNIGGLFMTNPYFGSALITNNPHVYTDSIITDTLNWTRIFGSFVADSMYNYVAIGNFFDDTNTDTLKYYNTFTDIAYYYVDDVCVSTDSIYCYNWTNISEIENTNFEIYPNPATDYITIHGKDIQSLKFFDITGRLQKELFYQSENIDISDLSAGIYLVEIRDRKNIFYKKIIKD